MTANNDHHGGGAASAPLVGSAAVVPLDQLRSLMLRAAVQAGADEHLARGAINNALQAFHGALGLSCRAHDLPDVIADAVWNAFACTMSAPVHSPLPDTELSRAIREARERGDHAEVDRLLRGVEGRGRERREAVMHMRGDGFEIAKGKL